MRNRLVRDGLARRTARQFAAELLEDPDTVADAFAGEELTAEERLVAHAELRKIAASIRATMPDGGF
jgi:hypothetical protein